MPNFPIDTPQMDINPQKQYACLQKMADITSGTKGLPPMDFGICVASKIDEIGYITHAENLGYSHAWVADSQMIWSDCYAVLALAAQQTRTIKLGTGVSVAGTRLAPVTASRDRKSTRLNSSHPK